MPLQVSELQRIKNGATILMKQEGKNLYIKPMGKEILFTETKEPLKLLVLNMTRAKILVILYLYRSVVF